MLKDGGEFALALASTTAVPTHPKASIPDTPENVDQAVLQEKLELPLHRLKAVDSTCD